MQALNNPSGAGLDQMSTLSGAGIAGGGNLNLFSIIASVQNDIKNLRT